MTSTIIRQRPLLIHNCRIGSFLSFMCVHRSQANRDCMMHALPRMYINIIEVIVDRGQNEVATAPSPSASLCILSHVVCAASINGRAHRPGSGTKCMARTNKSECIQISNIYNINLSCIIHCIDGYGWVADIDTVERGLCIAQSQIRLGRHDSPKRIHTSSSCNSTFTFFACMCNAHHSSPHRTAHTHQGSIYNCIPTRGKNIITSANDTSLCTKHWECAVGGYHTRTRHSEPR